MLCALQIDGLIDNAYLNYVSKREAKKKIVESKWHSQRQRHTENNNNK